MSYPIKLRIYNTGRTVFIKQASQTVQRHVFNINNVLCVIFNRSLFRLVKKVPHKIQQTSYYTIAHYKKIEEI